VLRVEVAGREAADAVRQRVTGPREGDHRGLDGRGDPAIAEELLRQTFSFAPASKEWIKTFLPGDGYGSTAMHHLAGTQAGAAHVIRRLGIPHRVAHPARPVGFQPRHIPQYLPTDWYDPYFGDIVPDADAHWIRRAVPIMLVRICAGGSLRRAGPMIGLPRNAGRRAIDIVTDRLARSAADRLAGTPQWNR
jgi:hypothetical protein